MYHTSILIAKYFSCVFVGTILFHMHICFKMDWADAVKDAMDDVGGIGQSGTQFTGKLIVLVLSLLLQKIPVMVVRSCFSRARKQRRKVAQGRDVAIGHIHSPTTTAPWIGLFVLVVGSFAFTLLLTSKGLFESAQGATKNVPCGCQGIAKSNEGDWLELILLIVLFRTLIYRPLYILVAVLLHFGVSKCDSRSSGGGSRGTYKGKGSDAPSTAVPRAKQSSNLIQRVNDIVGWFSLFF